MKKFAGIAIYLLVVMALMEVTFSHPLLGALLLYVVASGMSSSDGKKHYS